VGDRILLSTDGWASSSAAGRPQSPIDMAVIGFIDEIEILRGVS
jgi:microcompartment protein CcmK/EutM